MTNTKLAIKTEHEYLTEIETAKNIIAPGATDEELKYFAKYCSSIKLNPIAHQIHFVKRGNRATFQTSIDGFRVIAERSGKYRGQTDIEFGNLIEKKLSYKDKNYQKIDIKKDVPEWAKIGVYRQDFDKPIYAIVYWDEYCPSYPNQSMWIKMPRNQLAKCAEALALRKAFPNDLSGLYTDDEMQQADKNEVIETEIIEVNNEKPLELAGITEKLAAKIGNSKTERELEKIGQSMGKSLATNIITQGEFEKLTELYNDKLLTYKKDEQNNGQTN